MGDTFGLVCRDCGAVTLFGLRAIYPRCCGRCGLVLQRPRLAADGDAGKGRAPESTDHIAKTKSLPN